MCMNCTDVNNQQRKAIASRQQKSDNKNCC